MPVRVLAGAGQTEALGRALAPALEAGDLLALEGELGAGKTTLVRGVAAGLGIDPSLVRSPTFVLHHVYAGGRMPLHHVDCYRLGPGCDLEELDLDALLADGVVAVEWAGHAEGLGDPAIRLLLDAPDPGHRRARLESATERLRLAFLQGRA